MMELGQDSTKRKNSIRTKGLIIFWILFAIAFIGLVILKLYLLITTFFE